MIEQVEAFNIPFDRFEWKVYKIVRRDEHGEVIPAVKAIGMATFLCVLGAESNKIQSTYLLGKFASKP